MITSLFGQRKNNNWMQLAHGHRVPKQVLLQFIHINNQYLATQKLKPRIRAHDETLQIKQILNGKNTHLPFTVNSLQVTMIVH